MKQGFEFDSSVNALYLRFQSGSVVRTLEVENNVFLDVDEHGKPLGLEFVNADDL